MGVSRWQRNKNIVLTRRAWNHSGTAQTFNDMIKNEEIRNELKGLSRELYAVGQRIRALSTQIALNETSRDGDELFNIGSYVGSQIANLAQIGAFSITIDGDTMTFEDWNEE